MSNHIKKTAFTCPFWREGKCKFSDAACKYAHRETGATAKKPKGWVDYPDKTTKSSRASEAPLSERAEESEVEEEDLIHFSDRDEKTKTKTKIKKEEKRPQQPEPSEAASIAKSSSRSTPKRDRKAEFGTVLQNLRIESLLNPTIGRGDFQAVKGIVEREYREQAHIELDSSHLVFALWQAYPSREIVQFLLSYQTDPCAIPRQLWCSDDELDQWGPLTPSPEEDWDMKKLTRNVTLDLKYFFRRALKLRDSIKPDLDIARLLGLESLVRAPYHIIGQDFAISSVLARIKVYLSLPNVNGRPLILAFAGPQGHGKRLLAQQIDPHMAMWDESLEERGFQDGTKLPGNRDARNPSVIYCDLETTDGGNIVTWLQSTMNEKRDMSRTIIVLSTTQGEKEIVTFSRKHLQSPSTHTPSSAPWGEVIKSVSHKLCDKYGSSLVSLIDGIIPFAPFSEEEQIALVHQYIVDVRRELQLNGLDSRLCIENWERRPKLQIELSPKIAKNVCSRIAAKGYDPRLGAHSLEHEVHATIKMPLILQYLNAVAANASTTAPDAESKTYITFKVWVEGEEILVSEKELNK